MDLNPTQVVLLRIGALIIGCTLLLTASFIGVIAIFHGAVTGFAPRVPWYLVVSAIVFVATIILLEFNDAGGRTIITTGLFTGIATFALVFLAWEGLVYAIRNPEAVFVSQLIMYFIAAALVATGIGYWGLRHWREFTGQQDSIRT